MFLVIGINEPLHRAFILTEVPYNMQESLNYGT